MAYCFHWYCDNNFNNNDYDNGDNLPTVITDNYYNDNHDYDNDNNWSTAITDNFDNNYYYGNYYDNNDRQADHAYYPSVCNY